MPKEFDFSAMRANLGRYVREMGDLATSGPEADAYTNFVSAVFEIHAMTDFFYTPDAEGKYPPLTAEQKQQLMEAYQKAIAEAGPLIANDEETGPVGEALRSIARELTPMLQMDQVALEMAGSDPVTLPEQIAKGRSQIVDFGDQPMPVSSGASSQRRQITVNNGLTTETGFFTPTATADPARDYTQLLDRLEKKYPPEYKPLLDDMRRLKPARINRIPGLPWAADLYRQVEGNTPEERMASMKLNLDQYFYDPLGVDPKIVAELAQRPDFMTFSDELYSGVKQTVTDHDKYMSGQSFLHLRTGANIDKRNTAVTRTAALLGVPDLVAKSRPMTVIQNGVPMTGTFMEEAHGVDLTHIREGDPVTQYKDEAFDNPFVLKDIAAMQALDFITGNVDRHPGNYFLRFNPKDPENAKLVGLTLIDNDLSFSHASADRAYGNNFVLPREMGVIGEDVYNAMRAMTREQMEVMLRDCGLSREEINNAWSRKEALQKQIENDIEYFNGKAPGYTEEGKIRLVKEGEWSSYSVRKLARTHVRSQFVPIAGGRQMIQLNKASRTEADRRAAQSRAVRMELGIPVPAEERPPVPEGKVLGTELMQAQPVPERTDTVHVAIPSLSRVPHLGNALSRRYLISFEEDGKQKEVFFTPPLDSGLRGGINQLFEDAIRNNPRFETEIRMIQDYYTTGDINSAGMPLGMSRMPHRDMGFSTQRWEELKKDPVFPKVVGKISSSVGSLIMRNAMLEGHGLQLEEGKRIEVRNVAMSDVADVLGVSDQVLARSRPAKVMTGGEVIDGIVMDRADGEDISGMPDNHPMAHITAEQAKEVYNTEEGLKSIADLQILDYVCLNIDRHAKNMVYRFEGLETGNPRFLGVTGIDNDASFGSIVPHPDQRTNKLPPLNGIKVISEEMAKQLEDPQTEENLRKKMAANGLSEAEIQSAVTRFGQIREKVRKGDIRIVKKGEWAKGENTLEKLSADDSLFETVKRDCIDFMAGRAEKWKALPENKKTPYVKKKLKFAKSMKVDGFGAEALNRKELRELERQAEEEFVQSVKERVMQAPQDNAGSEMEFVRKVAQTAGAMGNALRDADPTLHRTSRAYKNLRQASEGLKKLAVKLGAKLTKPEDKLSTADARKLIDQMNKLKDCSEKYNLKKASEVERGKELDIVEQARVNASTTSAARTDSLVREYDLVLRSQISRERPMQLLHNRLQSVQSGLSGLKGDNLHTRVATILYYKGLSKLDITSKKENYLKNALMPEHVKAERENIKNTPAFRQICRMKDSDLRALAAGKNADKLLDRYVSEMAKEKQQEKKQNQQQPEVRPDGPEAGNVPEL